MENKVRLIDMNTLWRCGTCLHNHPNGCDTYCDHGERYRPDADRLVVIDPESLRQKGRWAMKETMIRSPFAKNAYCSECLEETSNNYNFCPNCGADMREGK